MAVFWTFVIFWAIVGGAVGAAIGSTKGRSAEGFWLGLLLGFIGWIIVAVMEPSEEVRRRRTAEMAAMVQTAAQPAAVGQGTTGTRECPFCAETIKAQAKVCRFCGRDVKPLTAKQRRGANVEALRSQYPAQFDAAVKRFNALPEKPTDPIGWLRELCKRIEAGSPAEAAASNIPLDWSEADESARQEWIEYQRRTGQRHPDAERAWQQHYQERGSI